MFLGRYDMLHTAMKHTIAGLCMVLLFCGTVFAAGTPTDTLSVTVNDILSILKEPNYKDPVKRVPLRAQIEKKVHEVFDFSEFSARTVGRNWQSFSAEQKERFDKAFANLLLITYLDKIQGYNGEQVAYTGEILSSKKDRAEVQTIVTLSDKTQVPVSYRMMLKGDQWVVYDVIIETISLIKNYRSQFQDVLTRGTPEQLIEKVENRARELQALSTVN